MSAFGGKADMAIREMSANDQDMYCTARSAVIRVGQSCWGTWEAIRDLLSAADEVIE